MKVMCIDDKFVFYDGSEPKYGEIVTASQCQVYNECYDLAEYPKDSFGMIQSFKKIRFIPLSDIDETELVKERELLNA